MKGVFVTATDTGAGKTLVSCGLILALRRAGLRVAGMKPVASGCECTAEGLVSGDARQLADAAEIEVPTELLNPYRFLPAIAPHVAAAEAGVRIDLKRIYDAYLALAGYADVVVVEGVGGLRVPLNDRDEVAHLLRLLELPVILVVGMRLGCLNHALLTAEALARRDIAICGWVANHLDPTMTYEAENVRALEDRLDFPLIGRIPFLPYMSVEAVVGRFDLARILAALGPSTNATGAAGTHA